MKNLVELSSLLYSLCIYQRALTNPADPIAYLLGQIDFDWAPVILDLFSNKLDKLQIANTWYPNYLPKGTADLLRKVYSFTVRMFYI